MARTESMDERVGSREGSVSPSCGSIRSIRLENFMCHRHLDVSFGSHANFVCGQNGSGKSAVIAALQCCLGASARSIRRGNNAKDLVRSGCDSSRVVVSLWNVGEEAYRPDLYGEEIRIERRIGINPTICLKDSTGRIVARGRGELIKVLDHFSCDAENPCTVMTQEHTRNFLGNGSDAKKKFRFYMEATMLQDVAERLAHADVQMERMGKVVETGREQVEKLQKDSNRLKQEIERAKEIKQLELLEDNLMCQLAWSHVAQVRDRIRLHKHKLEKGPAALLKMRTKLEEAKAKAKSLQDVITEKTKQLEQAGESISGLQQKRRELEGKKRVVRLEVVQAQKQLQQCTDLIRGAREREGEIGAQMEKLQEDFNNSGSHKPVHKLKYEVELDRARLYSEKHQQAKEEELHLSASEQQLRSIIHGLQAKRDANAQEVAMLQRQHQRLLSQSNNLSAAFGELMPKLVDAINQNRDAFHRPPLGPLGCLVTLAKPKWATAVDAAISASLSCIVVHDFHDMTLLKRLAVQVGMGSSRLSVVVYNYDTPPYKLGRNGIPQDQTTVLDVLRSSHPAVLNVLIDQNGIERVALVENIEIGKHMIFQKGTHSLKSAFLPDGTEIFKAKASEIIKPLDLQQSRKGPSIGSDVGEQLKQCSSAMVQTRNILLEVDGEMKAVQERLKLLMESLSKAREKTRSALMEKEMAEAKAEEFKFEWQTTSQQPRVLDLSILEQELAEIKHKISPLAAQQVVSEKILLSKTKEERDLEEEIMKFKELVDEVANEEVEAEIKHSIELKSQLDKNVQKIEENMQLVAGRLNDLKDELVELQEEEDSKSKVASEVAASSQWEETKSTNRDQNGSDAVCLQAFASRDFRTQDETVQATLRQIAESIAEMYEGPLLLTRLFEQEDEKFFAGLSSEETQQTTVINIITKLRILEAEKLTARLQSVKRRIDSGESQVGGSLVQLEADHRLLTKSLSRAKRKLAFLTAPFEHLKTGLKKRKKLLSDSEKLCSREVAHHFNLYMMRKGHVGRVTINRKDETLDLSVRMNATDDTSKRVKDLRSLSGGERSYATLALVLSLGQQSDCPFRVMDEFDVFMDEVNRKISLNALVEFASSNLDTQFILLTPQDLSHIQPDGSFVKVIKMQAARD